MHAMVYHNARTLVMHSRDAAQRSSHSILAHALASGREAKLVHQQHAQGSDQSVTALALFLTLNLWLRQICFQSKFLSKSAQQRLQHACNSGHTKKSCIQSCLQCCCISLLLNADIGHVQLSGAVHACSPVSTADPADICVSRPCSERLHD